MRSCGTDARLAGFGHLHGARVQDRVSPRSPAMQGDWPGIFSRPGSQMSRSTDRQDNAHSGRG